MTKYKILKVGENKIGNEKFNLEKIIHNPNCEGYNIDNVVIYRGMIKPGNLVKYSKTQIRLGDIYLNLDSGENIEEVFKEIIKIIF